MRDINKFSIYGNTFSRDKKGYVIYLLVCEYDYEIRPTVVTGDDSFPLVFTQRAQAEKHVDEILNEGLALKIMGYEVRSIRTVKVNDDE